MGQIQGAKAGTQTATDSGRYTLVVNTDGSINVLATTTPSQGATTTWVSGTTGASPLTDTTSTSMIAAQGASVKTYLKSIVITNGHATVDTLVQILDGSTVKYVVFAKAAGGGATAEVFIPGTANTAWNAKAVTTGSSISVNLSGYTGA